MATEPKSFMMRPISQREWWFLGIGTILLVVIAFCGNLHIVQSSDQGIRLVRKVHFTLAETFVSMDAITSQPSFTASARYPLAIKALQRDGILETAEERDERVKDEIDTETEKLLKKWSLP